jgi:hypothetical protein
MPKQNAKPATRKRAMRTSAIKDVLRVQVPADLYEFIKARATAARLSPPHLASLVLRKWMQDQDQVV